MCVYVCVMYVCVSLYMYFHLCSFCMMSEIAWYCDLKSEAFIRKETLFFKVLTLKLVHKRMEILKIKPVPKKLLASQAPVFFLIL